MSEYEPCKVCGETAYLEHSKTTSSFQFVQRNNWKLYCSKVCRYADNWKLKKYWSFVLFIIAGLFLFGGLEKLAGTVIFAIFGILLLKLAYFERDYALRGGPEPRETKRKSRRNDTLTPIATEIDPGISNSSINNPDNMYVYSEILKIRCSSAVTNQPGSMINIVYVVELWNIQNKQIHSSNVDYN